MGEHSPTFVVPYTLCLQQRSFFTCFLSLPRAHFLYLNIALCVPTVDPRWSSDIEDHTGLSWTHMNVSKDISCSTLRSVIFATRFKRSIVFPFGSRFATVVGTTQRVTGILSEVHWPFGTIPVAWTVPIHQIHVTD